MSAMNNLATTVLMALPAEIKNPLDGVSPSIDVFGVKFSGAVGIILGGIWALALAIMAGRLIWSFVTWVAAKRNSRQQDLMDSADDLKAASIGMGGLVGVSLIIGAIIFFVQGATGG